MTSPESLPSSLNERLSALAAFLPVFSRPDFSFGEWQGGMERDGVITMPWFDLSPDALRFVRMLSQTGWVQNFDWPEWAKTAEATALRTSPEAVAKASPEQLTRLLTALVRADRFSEGTLAEAYEDGLLLRVSERADALLQKHRPRAGG